MTSSLKQALVLCLLATSTAASLRGRQLGDTLTNEATTDEATTTTAAAANTTLNDTAKVAATKAAGLSESSRKSIAAACPANLAYMTAACGTGSCTRDPTAEEFSAMCTEATTAGTCADEISAQKASDIVTEGCPADANATPDSERKLKDNAASATDEATTTPAIDYGAKVTGVSESSKRSIAAACPATLAS